MVSIVNEIITLLTTGFQSFATAFGNGLGAMVEGIFVTVTPGASGGAPTYALSTFGALCIVFMGISLVIGLSRFVLNWATSLGN